MLLFLLGAAASSMLFLRLRPPARERPSVP